MRLRLQRLPLLALAKLVAETVPVESGDERKNTPVAYPLPEDVKNRAEEKCAKDYPYLKVQDPGTMLKTAEGKVLVYVLDNKNHGLWLEV